MTSSAQLERDADRKRARIADTLDELRGRLTPGQIVDQVSDYVSEGSGGAFMRNLRTQCLANPVPVAFVGAGLAWLMLSGFREPSRRTRNFRTAPRHDDSFGTDAATEVKSGFRGASGDVASSAAEVAGKTREAAGQFGERISDYGEDARRAAHDLRDSVSDATQAGYERATAGYDRMTGYISGGYSSAAERAREMSGSIGQKASEIGDSVTAIGGGLARILREQPLVLAGLGLAIGSLLGAYLPTTDLEEKVMGDASDKLKARARDKASEVLDKGKVVGERAWQAAREAASEQEILPLDEGTPSEDKSRDEQEASLVPQARDGGEQVPGGA